MNPADQAVAIIHNGDRQWRDGVTILSDPPALAEYKRVIQPVILAGCATSGCHGNTDRGGFKLYTPPVRDAITYTNFYILTQYAKTLNKDQPPQNAFAGPVRRPMLNRTRPEESLLAEYGLPRGTAKFSHPDVAGFRPIYRNTRAPRYRDLMQWLGSSLVNVQPDYGITDVQLPATRPATKSSAPSTQPTTLRGPRPTTQQ
jgi:hypothetical protein